MELDPFALENRENPYPMYLLRDRAVRNQGGIRGYSSLPAECKAA